MKNKNFTKIFIVILLAFLLFPSLVSALTKSGITIESVPIWNKLYSGKNYKYKTKGNNKERETQYIATYQDTTNNNIRLFCVEGGINFPTNSSSSATSKNYSISTTVPKLAFNSWKIDSDEMKQVTSCYYGYTESGKKYYSIAAAQTLIWELVTGERDKIDPNKIFSKQDFAPYDTTGKTYADGLYKVITKNSLTTLLNEYKSILKCAARFNLSNPSWATSVTTQGDKKQELKYNDDNDTFSGTFSHDSIDTDLFNYYKITINNVDCKAKNAVTSNGIKCSCNSKKCDFSSENAITSPVRVTFNYSYKENGNAFSTNDYVNYYTKKDNQTLIGINGSKTKTFYLNIYTKDKPTYQIKIKKVDNGGDPISGVTFEVCKDITCKDKIGTTAATNSNGETTYTGLKEHTTYYVRELEGKEGYVTDKNSYSVTVTKDNKTGTASYATLEVKNTSRSLWLFKNTIDSDGKVISLDVNKVCSESEDKSGPKFNITTSDGKNVCLTYDGDLSLMVGRYTYNTSADKCPENTTNELEARRGQFIISKIPAGTYTIKEISSACGRTLPQDYIKTVKISEDEEIANVYMYNGVSGVIFNKIDENGEVLNGGLYSLQRKENGVYKDLLLKHIGGSKYKYEINLTDGRDNATYVLETKDGTINITDLVTGEYRFVEKQAPEGYEPIKDKDSTATFVVSDKGISKDGKSDSDFYQVSLVNHKIKTEGSYDSAELIVTIITGRKVINYVLVIGGLSLLLILFVILRKKFKK